MSATTERSDQDETDSRPHSDQPSQGTLKAFAWMLDRAQGKEAPSPCGCGHLGLLCGDHLQERLAALELVATLAAQAVGDDCACPLGYQGVCIDCRLRAALAAVNGAAGNAVSPAPARPSWEARIAVEWPIDCRVEATVGRPETLTVIGHNEHGVQLSNLVTYPPDLMQAYWRRVPAAPGYDVSHLARTVAERCGADLGRKVEETVEAAYARGEKRGLQVGRAAGVEECIRDLEAKR